MPLSADDQTKYKSLYLQTAREYVKALEDNLAVFKNDPSSQEAIEVLHRSAHSLTSQSKMMQYEQIANLASVLESIFQAKKEKTLELGSEIVSAIDEAMPHMNSYMDVLEKTDKESDLSQDVTRLRTLANLTV